MRSLMSRMPEIKQLDGYDIEEIDLRRYVKSILKAQVAKFEKKLTDKQKLMLRRMNKRRKK